MDPRRKKQKTLGERAKRVNLPEEEFNKCGLERRQQGIRQGRPLRKVSDWMVDNDFAGQNVLPPLEGMERLENEMRTIMAELEREGDPPTPQQVDRMAEDFSNFWTEQVRIPMPTIDAAKPPSKHAGKERGRRTRNLKRRWTRLRQKRITRFLIR